MVILKKQMFGFHIRSDLISSYVKVVKVSILNSIFPMTHVMDVIIEVVIVYKSQSNYVFLDQFSFLLHYLS